MNVNNEKIFCVRKCFNSYHAFLNQKELYEKQTECSLKVVHSKTLQNAYKKRPNVKYNLQLVYDEIYLHCLTEIIDPKLSQKVQCPFRLSVRTTEDKQSLIIKKMIDKNTARDFSDHTHLIPTIVKEKIEEEQNNRENLTTEEHVDSPTTVVNKKIEEEGHTEEQHFTTESTQTEKNQHIEDFHILIRKLKQNLVETLNVEKQIEKLNIIQELKISIEQTICTANITFSDVMLPSCPQSLSDSSMSESSIKICSEENLPELKFSNIDGPSVSSSMDLKMITFAPKSSRGRPKGASTRAIGLPKNHQYTIESKQESADKKLEIKNFKYYTETEKKLKILHWLFPENIVTKVMNSNYKINDQDIKPISVNNIADCVACCNMRIIEKHFEQQAFNILRGIIKEKNTNGPWTCQYCEKALSEESIQCDACLNWYDFCCMDLKKKPKQASWFCKACNEKIEKVF